MTFIDSTPVPRPPPPPVSRWPDAWRSSALPASPPSASPLVARPLRPPPGQRPNRAPPTVASSSTPSPSRHPDDHVADVGRSIWHSGFEVPSVEVRASRRQLGGATWSWRRPSATTGPKAASFPAVDLALESAGVSVLADAERAASCRTVPGDATGTGSFAFQVGPEFDLGSAVLTVGDAAAVQSVIALGSARGRRHQRARRPRACLASGAVPARSGRRSPTAWCAPTTRSRTVSLSRATPWST